MKIGINARYLQKDTSGIENYIKHLLLNLIEIDTDNEYYLFFGSHKPVPADLLKYKFKTCISKIPTNSQIMRVIWEHLYLPFDIGMNEIDVFHETSFIAPIIKKSPTIITIYDLAFLYYPECFTARNVKYLKYLLPYSIKKSDMIIAISENTKQDIINTYKVKPEKIKVTYLGVGSEFYVKKDDAEMDRIRMKYNIKKEFIFNISLISPRKNHIVLIKAFKMLKEKNKIDCQLVLAGGKGWLFDEIFQTVRDLKLENDIIFTGYISNDELLYFYNYAMLFVYPSLYEGFGLPILEAMACGCPVISSNASSIPEISSDAAVLVEPNDIVALADSICSVLNDKLLKDSLISKGFKKAKEYTWRNTALETLGIYNGLQ